MSSKITIHDVARVSGVSIKTVSRVLNREPNVKGDTRDRVQAAVAELRYRPNISARSLAGSKAYLIGVFFDNPSPGYITDVQLGAIARCREEGYHLIVEPLNSTADDVEEQVAPMLATLRMDGVILVRRSGQGGSGGAGAGTGSLCPDIAGRRSRSLGSRRHG